MSLSILRTIFFLTVKHKLSCLIRIFMLLPAVIGFYGYSDSGKTTLIIKVIKRLVECGYTIATVKKTDKNTTIDIKGKDTWMHGQAGATLTVLSSKNTTDIMIYNEMKINTLIKSIVNCGSFDIILVEGANDSSIPKIKIGDIQRRDHTILEYNNNFEEIISVIKKEIENKKKRNQF